MVFVVTNLISWRHCDLSVHPDGYDSAIVYCSSDGVPAIMTFNGSPVKLGKFVESFRFDRSELSLTQWDDALRTIGGIKTRFWLFECQHIP